jgi:hypothetical protein
MATFARPRLRLIRNVDAGSYLECFLVAAVAAVIGIRFYLELTGYPQIGGHGLHIAHMLWGGLFMVAAIVLLLAFLGSRLQYAAAIVGGLGFGTFIDELGKFITSDNNYFFQPTIAMIYVIFVLLFLGFRMLERRRAYTPEERLANSIDLLRDALLDPLATDKRQRALRLLANSPAEGNVARALRTALQQIGPTAEARPSAMGGLQTRLTSLYQRVLAWPWFHRIIVGGFLLQALISIGAVVSIIVGDPRFTILNPAMDTTDWGDAFGAALATGLVLVGVARLRYSRLAAYYWFKRSILVSIFIVQIFAFYSEQLGAIVGLGVDLVLLAGLDYMIGAERAAEAA